MTHALFVFRVRGHRPPSCLHSARHSLIFSVLRGGSFPQVLITGAGIAFLHVALGHDLGSPLVDREPGKASGIGGTLPGSMQRSA